MEEFRPVRGYEGLYEVSNIGNVRAVRTGIVMKPEIMKLGYYRIMLSKGGIPKKIMIHRLVAEAFLGVAEGKEVNHKNGVKSDNRVENLEWISKSENVNHSYQVVGRKKANPSNKRKVAQFQNGRLIQTFDSVHDAAKSVKTTPGNITEACNGRYKTIKGYEWKYGEN